MKTLRLVLFAVVACAQLAVPASMVWTRARTFREGGVWKFQTEPVDPVDAIRGRYIRLSFPAQRVPQTQAVPFGPMYAVLKEGQSGFAQIDHVSATPLTGNNVVKVDANGWYDGMETYRFPFSDFWVSERIAPQADAAYAGLRREHRSAYVTVRVRNGDAAMEELYIDGKPLVEFLRAPAAP
jgi:hypothetical protein